MKKALKQWGVAFFIGFLCVPVLLIAAPISMIGEGMIQLAELILSSMEWLEKRITKT